MDREQRVEYDKKRRQNPEVREKEKERLRRRYLKHKEENKKYREEHREELRAKQKEYMKRKRKQAMQLLGDSCFLCGKNERKLLMHKKDGVFHEGSMTPFLVFKNPDAFVLLCINPCHRAVHACMDYLGMSWEEIEERHLKCIGGNLA